jgi:hypothetical protein
MATLLLSLVLLVMCSSASVASGAPAATEHLYYFGPDGTELTDFEKINSVAVDQQTGTVYVLDGEAGALYKFEADGDPLDWGGTAPYISGNQISGLSPFSGDNESQVAVDSTSHIVYVTEKTSVRAFQEDGEAAVFTAGPGAGTSEIPISGEVVGVAVDANGAIYVSDYAGTVSVFAASGELLTTLSVPSASGNLGVGPDGTVYVVNSGASEGGVHRFFPDEIPVTAATTYTTKATIPRPSDAFVVGVGVDPVNGDIYVLETSYANSWIAKYDSSGAFIRFFGKPGAFGEPGEDGESEGIGQGVAVVGGGEEFQFYMGTNGDGGGSKVSVWGEVIEPGPPTIDSTAVTDVASTSATLRARINPNTFATTYRFEYGLGDCAVTLCTSIPVSAASIGAGHHPIAVSQEIVGLQPGTTYHYRVVAENSEGVTEGPSRAFTTQIGSGGFQLPDRRVWEMVTPPDKKGALISAGSLEGHIQAAAAGDGLAYLTIGSIEENPEGSRETGAALARRGDSGWRSEDITPPNDRVAPKAIGRGSEYKLFNEDLSEAVLEPRSDTVLSPEASGRTPYWRQNTQPPVYQPLVSDTNQPPGGIPAGREFLAATPDLDHVLFKAGPIYKWAAGQQLQPVSVLPDDEGGTAIQGLVGSEPGSVRHAISDDGSRVFWTSLLADEGLYVRDTVAGVTMRIDVAPPGAGGEDNPVFQGASADGSVVFFTDTRQLTEDASPSGPDLYRCEIPLAAPLAGCASLVNLSATGSSESAEVQGLVLGLSEDGARAYFVAKGVLDSAPNQAGWSAEVGEPNLYFWQGGQGVRFIATLSAEDRANWGMPGTVLAPGRGASQSAASSPSGRYLAFMSEESLTGEDNLDAATGQPVERVFRYDAAGDRFECVSCDPTGAAPEAEVMATATNSTGARELIDPRAQWGGRLVAGVLPQPVRLGQIVSTLYSPRAVQDNGRVFFNAVDSLVPADSNGGWDVYQYEPTGVGTCSASSGDGSTSRAGEGCLSLLSSGTADGPAAFFDASVGGDDVFFQTPARLSVIDQDQEVDIYDARVDGVAAVLQPRTECLGEACQPQPNVPNDTTPASATFQGPGNLKPKAAGKKCPKGKRKVRRKGRVRCVPRKQRKSHSRRRAGQSGGGAR